MDKELMKNIVGQDDAIQKISKAIEKKHMKLAIQSIKKIFGKSFFFIKNIIFCYYLKQHIASDINNLFFGFDFFLCIFCF